VTRPSLKQYSNTATQATTPPSDLGSRVREATFFASSILGIGLAVPEILSGVLSPVPGADIEGMMLAAGCVDAICLSTEALADDMDDVGLDLGYMMNSVTTYSLLHQSSKSWGHATGCDKRTTYLPNLLFSSP
jgi:hypothetical protein